MPTSTTQSPPVDHKAVIRAVFADDAAPPALSPRHLALMRRLRVLWVPVESGAPGVDVFKPLVGTEPTVAVAMAALDTADEVHAVRTLAELGLLIDTFVRGARLAPGRYAVPEEKRKGFAFAQSGVDAQGYFELREEHLTLLRNAQWRVMDSGSVEEMLAEEGELWPLPYIDGKRPYGDYSYYQMDMARLLGEPYQLDADGRVIADARKDARLEALHIHTMAALQVLLNHAAAWQDVARGDSPF